MPSCLECIPLPDQHSQDTHPDAAAGFEGDMSSTTECIPWSDQQSESLGSKVPVMRLRGGAPKKRRRMAYFRGSSSQSMDEMRVEIGSEEEKEEEAKTENPTESTEPDADTTQELTAAVIAQLNEESYSSEAESTEGRIPPIQIEYESGTDKWYMEDTPAVHMHGGTDITKAEAMSKFAEELTRAIYRSANQIAPVLIEDTNIGSQVTLTRTDHRLGGITPRDSRTIRSARSVSIEEQTL